MKLLVTGATGFVGSHVISSLMERNINIVATSTNILKAKEKVWFNKIKYVEFDLKNFDNAIDETHNDLAIIIEIKPYGNMNDKDEKY